MISTKDRVLLQDALDFGCDAFLTMERNLPTAAEHVQRLTGLRIRRPTTYWACWIAGRICTADAARRWHTRAVAAAEPDARLEIVFAEALRAVTHQQGVLDNVRSRATTLTGAAALVTPFFGTPVLQARDRAGWPTAVALVALAGVLASTFVICAPWWRWTFRASAAALLEAIDAGHDADSLRRHLAQDFERWVDQNEKKIRRLEWWFTAGLGFLLLELAAWVLQLTILER